MSVDAGEIQFRPAELRDATDLTTLAHEAKRHWGYSDEWMALWRDELTFTPEYLAQHAVHVAVVSERMVGVYALIRSEPEPELDHLWVHPDCLGRGVGRALVDHATLTARTWGATSIRVVSDPNAGAFYGKLGARRVGDVSSMPEGRHLPLLRLDV